MDRINVTKPSMPKLEEYIEEIKPIFDSCWVTNMGPVHEKFRSQLEDYLDVPSVELFANGHLALEMAIQALGLDLQTEGGEIITTPFTFVSTTHAIVRCGLKPVFCDIRESDYTIDPAKIEALITDKTVGIIPVHVYGNICDTFAIEKIAKKHNLKVIYDAAHTFGEKVNGIGVGNYGDASVFSFHATKVFNSIEGGAVAFTNNDYAKKLKLIKNFGINGPEEVLMVGGNGKMDEFRAAMGICNLRHVDEYISKRKNLVELYNTRLGNVHGIKLRVIGSEMQPNYSYYPVYFEENVFGKSRDQIYEELAKNNIFARKYFYPLVSDMECYRGMFSAETPVAKLVAGRVLTLPLYEDLSEAEVNHICDVVLG